MTSSFVKCSRCRVLSSTVRIHGPDGTDALCEPCVRRARRDDEDRERDKQRQIDNEDQGDASAYAARPTSYYPPLEESACFVTIMRELPRMHPITSAHNLTVVPGESGR